MAAQTTKIPAELGKVLGGVHQKTKATAPVLGNAQLPGGIEGGIAQLQSATIGTYKEGDFKGKPFFMAAGIVKLPREVDGVPIDGLQTRIGPIPICDTPKRTKKTIAENWKVIEDHVKCLLGVQEVDWGQSSEEVWNGFLATLAHLTKTKPHFRFRTWKGKKQTVGQYANIEPRVNHEWNMACPAPSLNGDASSFTEDSSEFAPADEADSFTPPTEEVSEGQEATESIVYEEKTRDELLELANGGDTGAGERLIAIGVEAGLDKDELESEKYKDWESIIAAIDAVGQTEEDWKPSTGEIYKYAVPDPKTKKKGKPVEVEVKKVYADKKTCDLLNNVNKKVMYKNIDWEALESAE